MKRALALIAAAASIPLSACSTHRHDRSETVFNAVASVFGQLRAAGQLPGLSSGERGQLSLYQIGDSARREPWAAPLAPALQGCDKACWVDLKSGEKELGYLFCADANPPKLLGSFRLSAAGAWQKAP